METTGTSFRLKPLMLGVSFKLSLQRKQTGRFIILIYYYYLVVKFQYRKYRLRFKGRTEFLSVLWGWGVCEGGCEGETSCPFVNLSGWEGRQFRGGTCDSRLQPS